MQVACLALIAATFASDLWQKAAPPSGNFFLSPYSAANALALVGAGARGQTAKEISELIQPGAAPDQIAAAFKDSRIRLTHSDNPILTIANSLWYQRDHHFLGEYFELARSAFGARVGAEDFIGDSAGAADAINRWVNGATHGKIPRLVSPAVLGPATRLVVCNAIYFKGKWAAPFPVSATRSDSFHFSGEDSATVPTMHRRGRFRLSQGAGFRLLELPYSGESVSMIVLLPDASNGLDAIEPKLSGAALSGWLAALDRSPSWEVALSLPRFTTASLCDLSQPLQGLGMTAAFDPSAADFSGMTGKRDLAISRVMQKAYIEVNEEGTVAAAVTGVTVAALAVMAPIEFRVDHPFLFLIRENATGTILFLGRITDPR